MTSRFASLTEQVIEKIVEDKDTQNTKRLTKVAKELFADYVKEKKLQAKRDVQCIIKQLLDSVFVISVIMKVSVRVNPYLNLDYYGYHKNLI